MDSDPRFSAKVRLAVGLAVAGCVAVFLLPAIPQDPAYHAFVDQRRIWGVPNFWNVISNLPFTAVGVAGLIIARSRLVGGIPELRAGYLAFFAGVILVGPGSALYHLDPTSATLVWDRLPMTLAFMAFFSVLIGESICVRAGRLLLWPLVLIGFASVVYWHFSEIAGSGDLRLYALVQFLPMVIMPLILLLFRSPISAGWTWSVIGAYAVSKAAELADGPIYALFGFVSGHSVKHLLAAGGGLIFAVALRSRNRLGRRGESGVKRGGHTAPTALHTGDDK